MNTSIFGWDYPPGCSSTPYDEDQVVDLEPYLTKLGVNAVGYWTEDGTIHAGKRYSNEGFLPKVADLVWNDALSEEQNGEAAAQIIAKMADWANMICGEKDVLEMLGAENVEQAQRHVYKYTDCGAWISFCQDGIELGSIVEGLDFGTVIYPLTYPFTEKDYNERIAAIEAEASALWEWGNVLKDKIGRRNPNGKTDAERGYDTPDVECNYHFDTNGRSS